MTKLPAQYADLLKSTHPLIQQALLLYGVSEVVGKSSNPIILEWAKEIGQTWYVSDDIPWCGLFVGVVAHRAGVKLPAQPLRARSWSNFGGNVPIAAAGLGDVLVFSRGNAGHVGLYVGNDGKNFHVLGGNQGDTVSIVPVAKARLIDVRRCPGITTTPKPVQRLVHGQVSTNEA